MKRKQLTLAHYVHRRNGVPLGHSASLKNMLYRSLGAGSFARFWQYWNPIWGYALGSYVYTPLQKVMPTALAHILTFVVSGAIHDGVMTLVRGSLAILFTPWFFLMGVGVIVGEAMNITYANYEWQVRVAINLVHIFGCLLLVVGGTQLVGLL